MNPSSLLPALLFSLVLPLCLSGAAVEKHDLFVAGEGGYAGYRIPALVVTPQQSVLAICEARRSTLRDWGHIDLVMRRSVDGGRTWEPARVLVGQRDLPPDIQRNPAAAERSLGLPGAFTINNPSWIADGSTAETHLLFCAEYDRAFIITTRDGGATFSRPREITRAFETFRTRDNYAWRVVAIGPGHGVRLSSGRLVAPVWISLGESSSAHHPSHCATIYSDDRGATWRAGEIIARNSDDLPDPNETAIVEIEPGRVMVSIRNESPRNRRALAWSADGATGWSRPQFHEDLWEPICMAGLTRLDPAAADTRARLIFSNPASLDPIPDAPGRVNRQRINLSLRFSLDAGQSWSAPKLLEAGPSAYSDLAVTPDETVLCLYERGSQGPYDKITIARIPAAWLFETRR